LFLLKDAVGELKGVLIEERLGDGGCISGF
jgi:hypothetical protein